MRLHNNPPEERVGGEAGTPCVLGFDVGTSSSKAVLVARDGRLLAQAVIEHRVSTPRPGRVEMDGEVWWEEFSSLTRRLLALADEARPEVLAVGLSGMGPCVLLADERGEPVHPAILYGVDSRASAQIDQMHRELGAEAIVRVCGSALSSQAAGPKVLWVAQERPQAYARARRLFMPASFVAYRLTGAYVLDHQSASQCTPLYDVEGERWHEEWWQRYAPGIEMPELRWAGDIAGGIGAEAAAATGLPEGVPVIAGTIDAWSEAVSVDAHNIGDLMLMYGTTMFLVATGSETLRSPSLWTTAGAFAGSRNLAGGLSTSGSLMAWGAELMRGDFAELFAEAEGSPPGANGLLALPYFAGERTPILDPSARGVIAGLSLSHTRGDVFRALLEAIGFGIRHNIETMREAGAKIERVVAVGGGTRGRLWLQIVSDITGLPQEIPSQTIGASYGAAFLAARAVLPEGELESAGQWNPVVDRVAPDEDLRERYDRLYDAYRELYTSTSGLVHSLAATQR